MDDRPTCECGVYAFGGCVECSPPLCAEHARRIESVGIKTIVDDYLREVRPRTRCFSTCDPAIPSRAVAG
jgi:hypothetical protein